MAEVPPDAVVADRTAPRRRTIADEATIRTPETANEAADTDGAVA